MQRYLETAIRDAGELLARLSELSPELERVGMAFGRCWDQRGKVLIAGNGGSAADAMHFAEELIVRYRKDRRALAAIALCDPTVITCGGNDYGYDTVP